MDQIEAIQTYLTTSPESQFLGEDVRVVEQLQGSENLLWRIERAGGVAMLKMFLDAGQVRSRRQFTGQEAFARFGLAPRPLWVEQIPEGLPRPVLVYDWADGEMPVGDNNGQMYALATALAQVHSGDPNMAQRFSPHPVNLDYFARLLSTSITQIDSLLAAIDARKIQVGFANLAGQAMALINHSLPLWQHAQPTPIHGEIKLENVLDNFGSAIILDWEMFGLGDPALEVATFLHLSQHELDEAMRVHWLAAYLDSVGQPEMIERIKVYRTLLPFQSVCFLLNGLRELAKAGEMPGIDDADTHDFLAETLSVSWRQAANRFESDSELADSSVHKLFDKLTNMRG